LLLWVALLAFADLVADEATDRRTANRSERAAAGGRRSARLLTIIHQPFV